MDYVIKKTSQKDYENTIKSVKEELSKEGFGVLTEIDVQITLKEKIGLHTPPYMILGACNPQIASRALQVEQDIGVLLPCNLIIYEKEGEIIISAIKPTSAMSMIDKQEIRDIAKEVEEKLERVVENA